MFEVLSDFGRHRVYLNVNVFDETLSELHQVFFLPAFPEKRGGSGGVERRGEIPTKTSTVAQENVQHTELPENLQEKQTNNKQTNKQTRKKTSQPTKPKPPNTLPKWEKQDAGEKK